MSEFTGYDPRLEDRDGLRAQSLQFSDVSQFLVSGDVPDTRRIKDLMRRDDQGRINSCSGFGLTHAAEVGWYLQSAKWRQFHPMWSYRRGQEQSGIRGDRGATIHGVVKAAKEIGLLPEDFDGDGRDEIVYVQDYNQPYPPNAYDIAKQWKVGYSVVLESFEENLKWMQANQGAVVVGGAWGNWRPDRDGIVRSFRSGGGGHARAYIDWITIGGDVLLVEANSHYTRYGDNGFAYWTEKAFNEQARDRWTVTIGISDLDSPEPRKLDWSPW